MINKKQTTDQASQGSELAPALLPIFENRPAHPFDMESIS